RLDARRAHVVAQAERIARERAVRLNLLAALAQERLGFGRGPAVAGRLLPARLLPLGLGRRLLGLGHRRHVTPPRQTFIAFDARDRNPSRRGRRSPAPAPMPVETAP